MLLYEMRKAFLTLALFWSLASSVLAATIETGSTLPQIMIQAKGELVLVSDKITYQSWQSDQHLGKAQIVQHLAARMSASKLNQAFYDALHKLNLPKDRYASVSILNLDDTLWGSSWFVISEMRKNKKKYPHAILIADFEGVAQKTWQLEKKSSAIMLIDKTGSVRYFKEGKLSENDILQLLTRLHQVM